MKVRGWGAKGGQRGGGREGGREALREGGREGGGCGMAPPGAIKQLLASTFVQLMEDKGEKWKQWECKLVKVKEG